MQTVWLVMGPPASGKSTHVEALMKTGDIVQLNRDTEGGKVIDLLPKLQSALKNKKDVILDNLFATAESRKPFIQAAKTVKADVVGVMMNTSLEDSQINVLMRMMKRHGRLFFSADQMRGIKDPGLFPPAVLFKYRKDAEKPTTDEGFSTIVKVPFNRKWGDEFVNPAIIFDFDGTLRDSTGEKKYPISPDDVEILPGRVEKLKQLQQDGMLLLGASNQSGIGKGVLTSQQAEACFDRTFAGLGMRFDYLYCPHLVPPVSCYCRKPQVGMGVHLINEYKLDPAKTIVVGDSTSDKTFATRCGFQFEWAKDFFDE